MGKKLCIDAAREDDSLGRLINDDHVSPNSRMRIITVDRKPHLCLFAIKDIRPGEEITYNYGDSDWPWRLKVSTEAHPHHAAWASDCTKDVKQLLGERESLSCPVQTRHLYIAQTTLIRFQLKHILTMQPGHLTAS
ncbi:N-lysine methyltransferase KMT5A-A-like isoform X1 [Thunnus maccoyii]|uniref:N-lysine methyltransferase KMT5A-A-like isoform X1 n=1 Tax=Thunnus maccoyii TaxID=8240 RepID=UPI001C4C9FE5|nr:N-lysine methyltransferase KMT5A-A-like isoform X1 [Thunnus maccoyii]